MDAGWQRSPSRDLDESQHFVGQESPQMLDDLYLRLPDRQPPDVNVAIESQADRAVRTDQPLPRDRSAGKASSTSTSTRSGGSMTYSGASIIAPSCGGGSSGIGGTGWGLRSYASSNLSIFASTRAARPGPARPDRRSRLGLLLGRRARHRFGRLLRTGRHHPAREEDDKKHARCGGKFFGPLTAHESMPLNAV